MVPHAMKGNMMRFTPILIAAILAGCTTMYPPSPMTHDQNPGPMAESTVVYESVDKPDEPTPIYDDKFRYDDVRIRDVRVTNDGDGHDGGCMREHYSQGFDSVRVTTWTFANERSAPPLIEIGYVDGEEDIALSDSARVPVVNVSSSRELRAWFGTVYNPNSEEYQFCMKRLTWYPAATGGNFVVQDPTRRDGIVLQHTSYVGRRGPPGDNTRIVSWARAAQFGWLECERRVDGRWKRITDWRECAKYKPDQLVFFHVLGNWI